MQIDSSLSAEAGFALRVLDLYIALISFAHAKSTSETTPSLGGQLFYAGPLNDAGRTAVVAANIAGAATLCATVDSASQRQAIRDGVVDFVVTNLDEALRILKNEVRKRETVAVCVAAAPESIEAEMRERGVAPDLIAGGFSGELLPLSPHARVVEPSAASDSEALLQWSVAAAPAQGLPKLDAIAHQCLPADAWQSHRWLRLSPRYLGRLARNTRVLRCDPEAAANFVARVNAAIAGGEVAIGVEVQVTRGGVSERHRFPAVP